MTVALEKPRTVPIEGEALGHLEEILTSPSFAASRRCQQFLSFVVRETLEGRSEEIKERTIAMSVFGKDHRFEPGEDSLVRVKAHEVRKRLAEFYDLHPDTVMRIELPLGGYVPRFQQVRVEEPAAPAPAPAAEPEPSVLAPEVTPVPVRNAWTRRGLIGLGAAAVAGVAIPAALRFSRASETPLDQLWKPVFATRTPMLIAIPLLTAPDGSVSDRVGLGAAAAANEAGEYFVQHGYPYRLRFGADFTFSQLREQPSLLLGGFSSEWTTRITQPLRFSLLVNPDGTIGGSIRDAQTGTQYGPVHPKNGYAPEDYALVCRLFDANAGQIILIAAGITTFGTENAGRCFFRPALFSKIIAGQGDSWQQKNFQAVIRQSVIGTTPSAPTIIATHFW